MNNTHNSLNILRLGKLFIASAIMLTFIACSGGSGSEGELELGIDDDDIAGNTGDSGTGTPPSSARCNHFNALRSPFFGDLHVHTGLSLDARTTGTTISPTDSYRFAKGEEVGLPPNDDQGNPTRFAQLARPMDFVGITDHVELFGETEICTNQEDYPVEYQSAECQFFRQSPENAFLFFNFTQLGLPLVPGDSPVAGIPGASLLPAAAVGNGGNVPRLGFCGPDGATCLEAAKTPWLEIQAAAEEHYDRSPNCSFTSFVAYEYTAAPRSFNLHRNVIFRSDSVPEQPPAYQENTTPERLWEALTDRCRPEDNCNYLTIPHNSNLSGGFMFDVPEDTAEYAETRQFNEPLAEIYQHKGQSECLNVAGIGVQDELCDYEIIPYDNLSGNRFGGANAGPPKKEDYLREALKDGLVREENVGVNPFKYGFISSTDTHLGTPGLDDESDYPGHGGASTAGGDGLPDEIEFSPGGLAVLYAEENTRESLYAAMRRRETYATTGTRPIVRFFGGWNLPANMCARADSIEVGYDLGVPMGGDLPAAPDNNTAPTFVIGALRDPNAAGSNAQPLQRIQIIKGWVEGGQPMEVVYEVAGDPNNGATVDTNSCAATGPGFASLCTVWTDPSFDASQHAFYYARVVENPSCRWSTLQCNDAGFDAARCASGDPVPEGFQGCCDNSFPKAVQERAWTSPIWYRPEES